MIDPGANASREYTSRSCSFLDDFAMREHTACTLMTSELISDASSLANHDLDQQPRRITLVRPVPQPVVAESLLDRLISTATKSSGRTFDLRQPHHQLDNAHGPLRLPQGTHKGNYGANPWELRGGRQGRRGGGAVGVSVAHLVVDRLSVSPDATQNTSTYYHGETPGYLGETAVCRASSEAMGLVDRGIVAGLQDRAGLLDPTAPVVGGSRHQGSLDSANQVPT